MKCEPSIQKNLYGHKLLFNNLIDLYKREKLPNKILLSGEKGIGKSTLAYHLINFVLSESEEYSYDLNNNQINENNRSFKLIFNKSNPNFNLIDVSKDKKNIDINQIRELIISLNKSSFNMKKRFVLIDNIEFLNVNSSNSLLKILEEPNDNIIFILIHNNKRVLPTIKSRCLNFKVFLTYRETIEITNKILNADIFSLINEEFMRMSDFYQLQTIECSSGSEIKPSAKIAMSIDGKTISVEESGDGPMDSVFKAISKAAKITPALDSYSVASVTEGMDAQAEVSVSIKHDDFFARGKGASTDVIIASAKAFINALNNLRWRKNHPKVASAKGI